MKFRFDQVRIQESGPFETGFALTFPGGLSVVSGTNGAGKTTIARHLKENIFQVMASESCSELAEKISLLAFLDERAMSDEYQDELLKVAEEYISGASCRQEARNMLSASFTSFLDRIRGRGDDSKLSGVIDDNGGIKLTYERNGCSPPGSATGDKALIALALNKAIREALLLDIPLVFDSFLSSLDREHAWKVKAFVGEISEQVIFLDAPRHVESLAASVILTLVLEGDSAKVSFSK